MADQIVLVDQEMMDQVQRELEMGSFKALKKLLQIFTSYFNEKDLSSSKKQFEIEDREVMLQVLTLMGTLGLAMVGKSDKKDSTIIKMLFVKNLLKFLEGITNEELLSKMLSLLSKESGVFLQFSKLKKQIVKQAILLFCEQKNLKVKFYAFVFLKSLFNAADNETKVYLFRKLVDSYVKNYSDFSLRNFDLQKFQENCLLELVQQNFEIGYLCVYNFYKKLSELALLAINKKDAKIVKSQQGIRSLLSLQFLVRVCQEFKDQKVFKEFAYPVVELINTVFEMNLSTKHLPNQLHLIDLKTRLGEHSYVPIVY